MVHRRRSAIGIGPVRPATAPDSGQAVLEEEHDHHAQRNQGDEQNRGGKVHGALTIAAMDGTFVAEWWTAAPPLTIDG